MSIKQSEFSQVSTLNDTDYFPVFGTGTNERISKVNLFTQIHSEVNTFIYPTIAKLKQAALLVSMDSPVYVRIEETQYKLYKITSIAAGANDIALNNGTTATLQNVYVGAGSAAPAVTGAKGGNAALTSLLTQLAALGIIVNSTT